MKLEKTYYKEVTAIQWTGEEATLEYLKDKYSDELKCWRTGDGSLRVNVIHYQGDYWLDVNDYLIHHGKIWDFCSKDRFQTQYTEK